MDISDGPGIRVSVFTQGCNVRCEGCFNKETWDISKGKPWTDGETNELVHLLDNPHVSGLTWLGGEPTIWAKEITEINKRIKSIYPDKTIWLYSGHLYEEIDKELLSTIDVLVDGPFKSELKVSGQFRGSSNQRIINLKDEHNSI
jgi:anaerobic ribonucleoside-triphosphate reductase activating protein